MSQARKVGLKSSDSRYALNAVCPYFTMFPIEYPLRILRSEAIQRRRRPLVCDPYCGRGTTVFAARTLGLRAYGIDVAPVAVAIARAKLAAATVEEIVSLADELLNRLRSSAKVPSTMFWRYAFHPETLRDVCALRAGMFGLRSDAAALLRAIMLGALHGPLARNPDNASYFSNQMPRTFAAKPRYSINYWRRTGSTAPRIQTIKLIRRRAERALAHRWKLAGSSPVNVRCSDSRTARAFNAIPRRITHVITSPPYYGLRTYSQDQWLRHWFLGGPPNVDYGCPPGLDHGSPELFAESMAKVWNQIGNHARPDVRLYVRFGGIKSRSADPDKIFRGSLEASAHAWRIVTRHSAQSANEGKRQAFQMTEAKKAMIEFDYVVVGRD